LKKYESIDEKKKVQTRSKKARAKYYINNRIDSFDHFFVVDFQIEQLRSATIKTKYYE